MRPTIFISYSHKDERWKDRLVHHLDVLRGELAVWDDRKIGAGDDWLTAIEKALTEAQVAVMLVTADFLRSDFIRQKEVPTLLHRRTSEGVWVVPLLVKACPWQAVDWLSSLQIRPKGAKPLAAVRSHQVDEHLSALALEIYERIGRSAKETNAQRQRLVNLNLLTKGSGTQIPLEVTQWIEEDQVLTEVPDVSRLAAANGEILYELVEFEVPEGQEKVRGLWSEHLDTLVKVGKLLYWSPVPGGGVVLNLIRDGELVACMLHNWHLLSRATVTVPDCKPLRQDPILGSRTPHGKLRFPDLPIKSDYLDLVETGEGSTLLAALKLGEMESIAHLQPQVKLDGQGRILVKWSMRLRGRREYLSVEIVLEAGEEPIGAHWMVWPSFRSATGAGWRTYYVYEHCTLRNLHVDTLWLQPGASPHESRLRRRLADRSSVGYPVPSVVGGEFPSHGGPPLALSLRDIRNNQEKGLYLVPLKVLAGNPSSVAVAIDFGASFSVAAVRVGDEGTAEIVKLLPELGCREAERALSLHLSENRQHVDAPRADLGLLATGLWLPTYSYARLSGLSGYLPSKLLIVPRLSKLLVAPSVSMRQLEGWLPITTFSIPAMSTGLDDLTEHVVADFKWETSTVRLRGLEGELREYYLSLFLDLVMADVVMNHSHGFPEKPVSLTFGYSLRSAEKQVKDYQESLCRVIDRCAAGFELALNDDVGIYDESRAARVPTECFGEVAVVADLGGCTLDLSIAAQGRPGLQFAEVADCACLGSNLLLRQIAENPRGYLPADGGWDFTDPQVTETQLRAWIHSGGASRLFGLDSGGRPECRELNLRGFGHAYEAGRARVLLDRYFRLIVEYMARNLVAYLIGHWYPHLPLDDHGRLRISVHLRGNGWRLRYQNESCVVATDAIRDLVRERSKALWGFVPENRYPFPENERHWVPARGYNVSDLKAETVKGMVGQAMPWSEVARNWYSHALVDLEMMNDVDFAEAYWFHKVPLRNLGTNHVEVREISPPLVLTGPSAEKQVEIRELEASLTRGLNLELHTWGVRVPVTPVIWEAVFRSRSFWPDSK